MSAIDEVIDSLTCDEKILLIKESERYINTGFIDNDCKLREVTGKILNTSDTLQMLVAKLLMIYLKKEL